MGRSYDLPCRLLFIYSYSINDVTVAIKRDEKYILEYCAQYDLKYNLIGTKLYEKLKKLNNKKLYDLIKKVQLEVRKSDELTDMARVSPSVAE